MTRARKSTTPATERDIVKLATQLVRLRRKRAELKRQVRDLNIEIRQVAKFLRALATDARNGGPLDTTIPPIRCYSESQEDR